MKKNQRRLFLFIFAAVQFTTMMDYLLFMPLGVEISRVFNVGPSLFGLIVSSYCVSAGVSGLLTALFLNSIPKVKILTWTYAGFLFGTLLCALAPDYKTLIFARCLSGLFGGLTAPVILALIADLFEENERGSAIGIYMLGFGFAAVAGVPFGLQLALHSTWRTPVYVIVGLGFIIWLGLTRFPKEFIRKENFVMTKDSFVEALKVSPHMELIAVIVCLTFAQMVLTPYLSPFLVKNAGVAFSELPIVFGVAGLSTIISAPLIGKLSDRIGREKIYTAINLAAIVITIVFIFSTHLNIVQACASIALLMMLMTGRFIVAISVLTHIVKPEYRTRIFTFNSAIQQLATGVASYVGGLILVEKLNVLENFVTLGCVAVGFSVLTSVLLRKSLAAAKL